MAAPTLDDDLHLIRLAAREAGAIAMGFFRRDPKVWWKEGNSPVSEADFAVDRFLKETLLGARPHYGWLSEEMEIAEDPVVARDKFFVVDPIDGTRAFLRGEDSWCVSIALIEAGRPAVGVIDAPALREVLTAQRGGQAFLNGEVTAAARSGDRDRLTLAMPEEIRRRLDPVGLAQVQLARNTPSLAYRLALVASGRLDGTLIRPRANDWDIAAGDLILQCAGGLLCDEAGEPRLYKLEGKRHGLLIAGAQDALPRLMSMAASAARPAGGPPAGGTATRSNDG